MVISRDCDALLCVLYREYLDRRAHGVTISNARRFSDDTSIHEKFMPKWNEKDICELCWELSRKGLLSVQPGDDKANSVTLTEDGIIYMEQRFPKGAKAIIDYLFQIAKLVIPWI